MKKGVLNKTDLNLIARYLSSQCSVDDIERVEKWKEADKRNQKILEILKHFWAKEKAPVEKIDINKCWQEVSEEAGITPVIKSEEKDRSSERESENTTISILIRHRYKRVMRYAALLLVIIALPLVWKTIQTSFRSPGVGELQEISVNNGERKNVLLLDGTKVTLDSGTQFRYPSKFKENNREVFLNGEGYFEVHSDYKKPFIIHANHAVIRVIGTKFNVRAWRDIQKVKVAVIEGKVSLNSEKGNDNAEVIISKGHMSVLSLKGKPSTPLLVDVNKELGWINREIEFEDVSLLEVLTQLERWYNVTFVPPDNLASFDSLNINIENNPLEDILELIAAITRLNYRQDGNTVFLSSGNHLQLPEN
jgi:ferric-dicitrate binding protein FerR (iron transport regulator)